MRGWALVVGCWWVLVAAAGCAGEAPSPASADVRQAAPIALETAGPAAPERSRETFSVEPELAEAALAAIALWKDATLGEYDPLLVVGDAPGAIHIGLVDDIEDCTLPNASGCMREALHQIDVSRAERPPRQRADVAA